MHLYVEYLIWFFFLLCKEGEYHISCFTKTQSFQQFQLIRIYQTVSSESFRFLLTAYLHKY